MKNTKIFYILLLTLIALILQGCFIPTEKEVNALIEQRLSEINAEDEINPRVTHLTLSNESGSQQEVVTNTIRVQGELDTGGTGVLVETTQISDGDQNILKYDSVLGTFATSSDGGSNYEKIAGDVPQTLKLVYPENVDPINYNGMRAIGTANATTAPLYFEFDDDTVGTWLQNREDYMLELTYYEGSSGNLVISAYDQNPVEHNYTLDMSTANNWRTAKFPFDWTYQEWLYYNIGGESTPGTSDIWNNTEYYNNDVSIYGSVADSTTTAAIGTASIRFPGASGDYLSIDSYYEDPTEIDTELFTIEFWVRFDDVTAKNGLFGRDSNEWMQLVQNESTSDGTLTLRISDDNSGIWDYTLTSSNTGFTWTNDTWYRVLIYRSTNGRVYMFINGYSQGYVSVPATVRILFPAAAYSSGRAFDIGKADGDTLQGYLDEFHFLNKKLEYSELVDSYTYYEGLYFDSNYTAPNTEDASIKIATDDNSALYITSLKVYHVNTDEPKVVSYTVGDDNLFNSKVEYFRLHEDGETIPSQPEYYEGAEEIIVYCTRNCDAYIPSRLKHLKRFVVTSVWTASASNTGISGTDEVWVYDGTRYSESTELTANGGTVVFERVGNNVWAVTSTIGTWSTTP